MAEKERVDGEEKRDVGELWNDGVAEVRSVVL